MSILLEALRKTEKQQKPAPTIHDEAPQGSASEPLMVWPLVAMIVIALFASGWAAWRQYAAPEGVYRPPVTLSPDQVGPTETAPAASPAQEAREQAVTQRAVTPQSPAGGAPPRQPRTPVESYTPPPASAPASTVDQAGASSQASGQSATTAGSAEPRATFGVSTVAGTARQPAREPDAPHIPEPIGYWELPDAVRADVPEIKFSVLVYDEDPEGRFVLAGGTRLGEGDELQPGVKVEEIRRDGVVFSYRLYRFLVGR